MSQQKFPNNAKGHLDSSCNDSTSAIDLNTEGNTNWPSAPSFKINVGGEIMNVDGVDTTDDPIWHLTVGRGAEGSTAAAHDADVVITAVLTKESLQQFRYADMPNILATDLDLTNIGDDVLDDSVGTGLTYLVAHSATFGLHWAKVPWTTFIPGFGVWGICGEDNTALFGTGLRESATGKIIMMGWHKGLGDGLPFKLRVLKFTSETDDTPTIAAEYDVVMPPGNLYLQSFYDMDGIYFSTGAGYVGSPVNEPASATYLTLFTEALTDFFTTGPDEIIFGGYHYGPTPRGSMLANLNNISYS